MTALKFTIPLLAAAMLGGSAYMHGRLTDRWGVQTERLEAAALVSQLPDTIGDWTSKEMVMGDQELAIVNVNSYVSRVYTNKYSGASVSLLVVCGRPGSVGAHPPDVCYAAAGYNLKEKTVRQFGEDTAWTGMFHHDLPPVDTLRLTWAWGTSGHWTASQSPRTQYASSPYLYKFYVIQKTSPTPSARDDEAMNGFLDLFIPLCRTQLALKS